MCFPFNACFLMLTNTKIAVLNYNNVLHYISQTPTPCMLPPSLQTIVQFSPIPQGGFSILMSVHYHLKSSWQQTQISIVWLSIGGDMWEPHPWACVMCFFFQFWRDTRLPFWILVSLGRIATYNPIQPFFQASNGIVEWQQPWFDEKRKGSTRSTCLCSCVRLCGRECELLELQCLVVPFFMSPLQPSSQCSYCSSMTSTNIFVALTIFDPRYLLHHHDSYWKARLSVSCNSLVFSANSYFVIGSHQRRLPKEPPRSSSCLKCV